MGVLSAIVEEGVVYDILIVSDPIYANKEKKKEGRGLAQ